jgi:RNA polymerase sigma factor for flagellar operon FliA
MGTLKEVNIEQVWGHYLQHHDIASRNILMEHYLPQVKYTAERLHARYPKCVELDDLYSAGIVGLIDVIGKFDPLRNVKFETYCVQRIQGAIRDDLRKNDRVPRLVRARAQQLQKVTQKLEAIFGHSPTDEDLADELDMNTDEFYNFQRAANASSLLSLNTSGSTTDSDGEFAEIDIFVNQKSQDPFVEIQKRDAKAFVTCGFTRQEKLIVTLYYYEEMTMKEIGVTLGISESRVSQINTSIIARLKSQIKTEACLI